MLKKHLKKIVTYCSKFAKSKYSGCHFLTEILVFYLAQKVIGKISALSSMLLSWLIDFQFSDVLFWIWSIHWNVKSDNTFGVRFKCMATSQVFFCFHRRFVIPKSKFIFCSGGADVLEIAFLAMNQIDHFQWITREFLPNKIRFTGLCARKSLRVDNGSPAYKDRI